MNVRANRSRASTTRNRAEALLFPLAAFLSASGLSKTIAERSFSRAFDLSLETRGARQLKHIGDSTPYADIVALWLRDRRFIDNTGRPRHLPLRGKVSFSALAREVSPKVDPQAVLNVLVHFRNVRKLKTGKYQLVSAFFRAYSAKSLAFEPMANFLSDAGDTLGRILKRKDRTRGADLFWRTAETSNLSDAAAKQFFAFSKERTLAFVNEIDEWLEAHRSAGAEQSGKAKRRRIGLGVFSIFSGLEASKTQATVRTKTKH